MIIENGICHQTFACGVRKREKHFVFVKAFLLVWSVTFLQENYFIIDLGLGIFHELNDVNLNPFYT